ncbi:MAG: hypothetical protein FWG42_04060 [Clostridiales bacterium]|nr:hypothetical protein [Clostridiales bacterium]
MKTLKLAILGYGNAGRAYGKLLVEKMPEIIKKHNTEVKVAAIVTKTKGTLIEENGIDLAKAETELADFGKFRDGTSQGAMEVAETVDYDVLVELTPLEIFSGQPAISHIQAALKRGKHVISANKGPIAWAFRELRDLAAENGCLFYYETTVMDGAPVFNLADEALLMCKVTEIRGILNSTTNFILGELEKGVAYEDAIEEGKRRGFVEADPAMDVEGWDAAAKIAALMNVLMDAGTTPADIDRKGIEGITAAQVESARERGKAIKLLCGGIIENGKTKGYVKPEEIGRGDIFASIEGTSSVVSITTDLMGTVSIVEHGPEIEQTAYGIFSDTMRVLKNSC